MRNRDKATQKKSLEEYKDIQESSDEGITFVDLAEIIQAAGLLDYVILLVPS